MTITFQQPTEQYRRADQAASRAAHHVDHDLDREMPMENRAYFEVQMALAQGVLAVAEALGQIAQAIADK